MFRIKTQARKGRAPPRHVKSYFKTQSPVFLIQSIKTKTKKIGAFFDQCLHELKMFTIFLFFLKKLGFATCKAEQPLQGKSY